ncbi:MAG: hypothetical protein QOE77_3994 [Blastocatellia bacterium]|jgi:hypothetical protein|nr:hypothetical protein [Blastocatellia bacterium]
MTNPYEPRFLLSRKGRYITIIAMVSLLALMGVAVGRTIRAKMQSASAIAKKDALVERIEASPDFSLRIQQDEDAPLRILEVKVKEISAADYEKLTSIKSDHASIISAPEVRMVNMSDKTICRVMLFVNDATANRSAGIMRHELSISPGAAFTIVPGDFVKPEYRSAADGNGATSSSVRAPMKDKNFWLPFADKSQLKVRVAVEFQDGTKWFNRDQTGGGQ